MIRKAYDYLFFTLYRLGEIAPSRWWSEWKAGIIMIFLWGALIATIDNLRLYFFRATTLSDYPILALSVGLIIAIIHYFMYIHKDKWRDKILKFRNIDKKKDIAGILLVIVLVGLIIFGLIYSIRLLGKVDWNK